MLQDIEQLPQSCTARKWPGTQVDVTPTRRLLIFAVSLEFERSLSLCHRRPPGRPAGPTSGEGWEQIPRNLLMAALPCAPPPSQEWVTSTELLISLDRLNTFGDDIFKDPKVLQSYYYAVSDFSVGGR